MATTLAHAYDKGSGLWTQVRSAAYDLDVGGGHSPTPEIAMPTPAPQPPAAANPLHAVLHGFWIGLEQTATRNPWIVAVVGLVLVTAIVRSARVAIHSGPRDPVRRFPRRDKAVLLARAGHRCEHHGLFGRCMSTDRLEADHIHPHSRGGWTHVSNGQILCKGHNQAKRANIPWDRSLRKISERRASYYPQDADRTIVRRPTTRSRKASA